MDVSLAAPSLHLRSTHREGSLITAPCGTLRRLHRVAVMQHRRKRLIEMVQRRAPFLIPVRTAKSDSVILEPFPSHQQEILIRRIEAWPDFQAEETWRCFDEWPGFAKCGFECVT